MTLKLSFQNIFERFKPGVQGETIYNTIFHEQEASGKKNITERGLGANADRFDVGGGWTLTPGVGVLRPGPPQSKE